MRKRNRFRYEIGFFFTNFLKISRENECVRNVNDERWQWNIVNYSVFLRWMATLNDNIRKLSCFLNTLLYFISTFYNFRLTKIKKKRKKSKFLCLYDKISLLFMIYSISYGIRRLFMLFALNCSLWFPRRRGNCNEVFGFNNS